MRKAKPLGDTRRRFRFPHRFDAVPLFKLSPNPEFELAFSEFSL